MTVPTPVATAFMGMGYATTRDEAQTWAQEAAARGATPADLAAAWAAWEQMQTYDVQTIGARCHCGRPVPTSSACGCCCANCDQEISQ